MNTEGQLKEAISKAIEAGKEISVKWDCGGDEAIMTIYIDEQQLGYNNAFAEKLDLYLMNRLNLPDAGPFSMQGGGKFLVEEDEVYFEYESRWKGYEGYDEDFNYTGWKEVDEKDEDNSGKIKLFEE